MIVFYAILLIILLCAVKSVKSGYNPDYLGKEQTDIIKGFFIWIVFLSHIAGYIYDPNLSISPNFPDRCAMLITKHQRQLLVAAFLFYSGYGVTLGIKTKPAGIPRQKAYGDTLLRKRVLPTLLNFDIAVLFFLIANLCLGIPVTAKQTILSLIAWDSLGNSNWYIFTICICYTVTWISYKIVSHHPPLWKILIICNLLLISYLAVMHFFKPNHWYDTCFCYGAGAVLAWYKDDFESFCKKHYAKTLVLSTILFVGFFLLPHKVAVFHNLSAIFFMVIIVILSLKFRLKSRTLEWCGQHLFPLYIYQRIPMLVLATVGGGIMIENYRYLYIIACIVISILLAFCYRHIRIRL